MANQSVTIRGPLVDTDTPDGVSTTGNMTAATVKALAVVAEWEVDAKRITANAVAAQGGDGDGVFAVSASGNGVLAESASGNGVFAVSANAFGVQAKGGNAGVAALNFNNQNAAYLASGCCAAWLTGDVHITGMLSKGRGQFLIDHPLDPANKFLAHSFVESPEMKNVYDGIAVLDANGEAVVEFPDWFTPLNMDFRYQLTPIAAPGPNLYIAEEISDNRFKIAGGTPMMKVSWQITGVRQDALAKAHPLQVESEKSIEERGYYLNPELYGATREQSIELVRHTRPVQPTPVERDRS